PRPAKRPSLTRATTTTASCLAPREIVNAPAMGQVSTEASTARRVIWARSRAGAVARERKLPQPAAGVGQEQVDATRVRHQVVVHGARALLLGLAHELLEVGEEAVDRAAELGVPAVALRHVVEARATLGGIDAAHHDAALAGPEARPDGRGRGGI